jgi:hypothetical protein
MAGALDDAGQQRARQRQVGAQRHAAGQAHGGVGQHVARAQGRRPGKGEHGQRHAGQPGCARPKRATARTHSGMLKRPGGEVAGQEQRLEGLRLQPVANEEQHQRGRHRAGHAVDQVHRQQAAKGRGAQRQNQAGGRAGPCLDLRGWGAAPAGHRHAQRHGEHRRSSPTARPATAARWPPARPPAPGLRARTRCEHAGLHRRPAVRPRPGAARQHAVAQVGHGQQGGAPHQQGCLACDRREEQPAKAGRQHQRRPARRPPAHARRVGRASRPPSARSAGRPRRPAAVRPAAARPAWPAGCRTRWRSGWAAPRTAAAPRRPAAGPARHRPGPAPSHRARRAPAPWWSRRGGAQQGGAQRRFGGLPGQPDAEEALRERRLVDGHRRQVPLAKRLQAAGRARTPPSAGRPAATSGKPLRHRGQPALAAVAASISPWRRISASERSAICAALQRARVLDLQRQRRGGPVVGLLTRVGRGPQPRVVHRSGPGSAGAPEPCMRAPGKGGTSAGAGSTAGALAWARSGPQQPATQGQQTARGAGSIRPAAAA